MRIVLSYKDIFRSYIVWHKTPNTYIDYSINKKNSILSNNSDQTVYHNKNTLLDIINEALKKLW